MNAPEFIQALTGLARNGEPVTDELKSAFSSFPPETQANLAKTINQDYPAYAADFGVEAEPTVSLDHVAEPPIIKERPVSIGGE